MVRCGLLGQANSLSHLTHRARLLADHLQDRPAVGVRQCSPHGVQCVSWSHLRIRGSSVGSEYLAGQPSMTASGRSSKCQGSLA